MKATTIKVDGNLLRAIEEAKPATQSVSAFVRSVLQKEIDRRRLQQAAIAYRGFIDKNEDERMWLEAWDRADLISPPTPEGAVE
jgi:hypothetical protein